MKKICLWIGIVVSAILVAFVSYGIIQSKVYKPQYPVATIEIEGYEKPIKIELDPSAAPNAVANFIKLANSGFYNDFVMDINKNDISTKFSEKAKLSEIVENPTEDYVYGIKGDFLANNVENKLRHAKGVITMKRNDYSYFGYSEEGYNSGNCDFRILTEEQSGYNGYYSAFGRVIEGIDVLDAIKATRVEKTEEEKKEEKKEEDKKEESTEENKEGTEENSESGEPKEENEENKSEDSEEKEDDMTNKIKIKSIKVDTFGLDYGIPEYNNYEKTLKEVNEICKQYFGSDYESIFGN